MNLNRRSAGQNHFCSHRSWSGAVLLEVLLALALFVFAATIITSSLNSGVTRVARLRSQLHALDLAESVLSEVKLGIIPATSSGAEPFKAPFDQWTWEVQERPYSFGSENVSELHRVTVIVKNNDKTAAQRLTEIISLRSATAGPNSFGGAFNGSGALSPSAANKIPVL